MSVTETLNDTAAIADNLRRVRERIADAAIKAGRRPQDVTLVAVSKTKPVAAVRAALAAEDVTVIDVATPCTACDDRFWSHRGRGDRQRHGMAVWLEASAA